MGVEAGSSSHPIERALVEAERQPLVAIDLALRGLALTRANRSDAETNEYLDVLAFAVCRASRSSLATYMGAFSLMVDDPSCHELAAAALIRLLAVDDYALEGGGMRGTVGLLDRVAGGRLYTALGITTRSQTFEKAEALKAAMVQAESDLQAHIDSLASLDALDAFRQQLTRLLNAPLAQFAIRPFLSPAVTPQMIAEVLATAQAVADAQDQHLSERVDQVADRCSSVLGLVAELPTDYNQGLIGSLAERLVTLSRERIRQRGLADPATIEVRPREKRYPLGTVGSAFVLRVDVSNLGPGQARDVVVSVEGQQSVRFERDTHFAGDLPPGSHRVDFPGVVEAHAEADAVLLRVGWRDPDGSTQDFESIIELLGWTRAVPWDELTYEDPYPLEPVTRAGQFVGREQTLNELAKVVLGATPGNARVVGQRRVGKTSIVLALAERLEILKRGAYSFIYIESGDFSANTAEQTIERLGKLIATRIIDSDPALAALECPSFDLGLSPLTELVAQAAAFSPERRFVVVLDEFDAMPHQELYDRGPLAAALYETLRSLGSKSNVGFILVGGERMRFVIAEHGMELNKFHLVPVDYFDSSQLGDYRSLLCEPVADWLEFDDAAIELLHRETAGNPWVTKLIAREVFARAVRSRDGDVRAEDVEAAIAAALPRIGASSFQHYWDDAIQGDVAEQAFVSTTRRKVLLAIANCLRSGSRLTEEAIQAAARRYGVDSPLTADVLNGFSERGILRRVQGDVTARVPLFLTWLKTEGVNEIVVSMGDDDALIRRQRTEEARRPKPDELAVLTSQWRTYRGQILTEGQISEWLSQFGSPSNQRLMLGLLQRLRYFNASQIAESLRNLHAYVNRDLAARGYTFTLTGRQRSRSDLVVCGLEGGGSGAAHLVKTYRDENGIYANRAVDAVAVPPLVRAGGVRAVLILEDFIATGGTARERTQELVQQWTHEQPWPRGVDIYLLAVCGFDDAVAATSSEFERLDVPLNLHVATPLDDADRCFSDRSRIFPDPDERERARSLCFDRGVQLEPKHPLGYRDTQAAVVFEMRSPNNSIPVLWKDGPGWRALFPRMPR